MTRYFFLKSWDVSRFRRPYGLAYTFSGLQYSYFIPWRTIKRSV